MFDRVKSLWTRAKKDEAAEALSVLPETRRNKQKNLKASPACIAAFAHLAEVSRMSEAALFEDMVAQRWEELHQKASANN